MPLAKWGQTPFADGRENILPDSVQLCALWLTRPGKYGSPDSRV